MPKRRHSDEIDRSLPDAFVDDEELLIVKPGIYDLAFVDFETKQMFMGKAPKLIMWFRIVTMGEFFETVLPRYYNVQKVIGKPKRRGRFKAGKKGDFLREYCTLFPNMIGRLDRIPMTPFSTAIIKGKIGYVERARGRKIPKELQYSRIRQLIKVVS